MSGGTIPDRARRRAIDERFLGLRDEEGPGRTSFVVGSNMSRPDQRLYGGAAVAVALASIERATGRDALWATTQLVSTAAYGARMDVTTEVVAQGHRASQVQVVGRVDGDLVFTSLGAAVEPKPDGLWATDERRPVVPPPEDGGLAFPPTGDPAEIGWHLAVEVRVVEPTWHPDPSLGRMCAWVRMLDGEPFTPARLSFVADLVPTAVARATGARGAGTSLDNTLRLGTPAATGWVLLDLRAHSAHGGYGHGLVHLWAEDGTLLATGTQTSTVFDFGRDPWFTTPARPTP